MLELRPGAFLRVFAEIDAAAQAKCRTVLGQIALAAERQAKINASSGAHKRGTKTPARPGSGPAVVSGTLRRSITHTAVTKSATGWECKVGTGVGFTPPYGKVPSTRYGPILEKEGLRNGARYPFVEPACRFAMTIVAPTLYRTAFGGGWPRA